NQGCLESITSATGLDHLMKKLAETFKEESSLKEKVRSHQQVSVKEIFDAAKEQDVFAVHVVTEFSYYIGLACAHITNTLDPDKIILGGGIAAAGQVLLD
ncbi:glucokinase, partial [Escherichia coli]